MILVLQPSSCLQLVHFLLFPRQSISCKRTRGKVPVVREKVRRVYSGSSRFEAQYVLQPCSALLGHISLAVTPNVCSWGAETQKLKVGQHTLVRFPKDIFAAHSASICTELAWEISTWLVLSTKLFLPPTLSSPLCGFKV